jgi:hypothetical protein
MLTANSALLSGDSAVDRAGKARLAARAALPVWPPTSTTLSASRYFDNGMDNVGCHCMLWLRYLVSRFYSYASVRQLAKTYISYQFFILFQHQVSELIDECATTDFYLSPMMNPTITEPIPGYFVRNKTSVHHRFGRLCIT